MPRKAIKPVSNINYYFSQGWSKEELIKKAFFAEKDFEDAGL